MNRANPMLVLVVAAAAVAFPAVMRAADGLPADNRGAGPVDVTKQLPADRVAPAAAPAGPLGEEVKRLIKQLGADDFKARDAAAARLREIGTDALGLLAEARKDLDPEIASRAAGLIRQISHRPSLFGRPGRAQGGALGQRVHVAVGPHGVRTEVFEGDQRIEINEKPGEISVSVFGLEDGRAVSERVTAATMDELRAKHPEAAALYERWGSNGRAGGGVIRINGMRVNGGAIGGGNAGALIIRGGANVQVNVAAGAGAAGDDLARLRRDVIVQMAKQKIPAAKGAEVMRLIAELELFQMQPVAPGADAQAQRMRTYNEKCDALRKLMAELNLPDPGPALPPPAQARLGVTTGAEGPDGVTVNTILPDSRAAQMGLKPLDMIKRLNDKPVTTAQDLRKLVTAAGSDKLVVVVTRDGKELKLEEPAAEKVEKENP